MPAKVCDSLYQNYGYISLALTTSFEIHTLTPMQTFHFAPWRGIFFALTGDSEDEGYLYLGVSSEKGHEIQEFHAGNTSVHVIKTKPW